MLLIAGLPALKAMVKVGPPLSCKVPRSGSAVKAGVKVPVTVPSVSTRLFMFVIGAFPTKSAPLRLLAMMVLERRVIVALLEMPPPLLMPAELPEIVVLMTLKVD